MGTEIYSISVSYVLINQDQINKNLIPSLGVDQSLHKWIRSHFPELRVIKGVNDERAIFDSEHSYLRKRLGYEVDEEDQPDEEEIEFCGELDFSWAAIILGELSADFNRPKQYISFDTNPLKKLFAYPKENLIIHNEVWFHQR